jgi:hypothetical protein
MPSSPTEHTALTRHACAACGGQAEWNPSRQVLACSFCGTESPGELDSENGTIREIDLVATLREIPDELRGWQASRKSVRCRSCQAVSVFEPELIGRNCDFCGSAELVDYDEIKAPIRPQSLLPFAVDTPRVRENMRRWYAKKWLAPTRFRKQARLDTIRGIYIPYWTFDAQVDCSWTAQSGHYYYTTQSYRDSNGKRRTRRVRHVRWQPASGRLEHFFDDQPIPGTRGLDPRLLGRIEPFPTEHLVPYDTAYLSGFVVEHYQVVLVEAASGARAAMERELRNMCAARVPGDTHRNLVIAPHYSGETFKHILVPVWILAYSYAGKNYPLLVNGYTGKMAGRYPKSPWKVALLILLAAVIVAVLAFAAR